MNTKLRPAEVGLSAEEIEQLIARPSHNQNLVIRLLHELRRLRQENEVMKLRLTRTIKLS